MILLQHTESIAPILDEDLEANDVINLDNMIEDEDLLCNLSFQIED